MKTIINYLKYYYYNTFYFVKYLFKKKEMIRAYKEFELTMSPKHKRHAEETFEKFYNKEFGHLDPINIVSNDDGAKYLKVLDLKDWD